MAFLSYISCKKQIPFHVTIFSSLLLINYHYILPYLHIEMDDKALRAVLAISGQVAAVTSSMSWERNQSSILYSVLPRVCLNPGWLRMSLCNLWLNWFTGQSMHSNRGWGAWGGTRLEKAGVIDDDEWLLIHCSCSSLVWVALCTVFFAHFNQVLHCTYQTLWYIL